jgi:predicted protein tyrosine phosphatase
MGNSCTSIVGVNDERWLTHMEQERTEGRSLLQRIALKSDDVDWETIIVQADFFHHREEQQLKKRLRTWRRKQTLQALDRRRRYDLAGPFSVNLLAMSISDEEGNRVKRWKDTCPTGSSSESQTASCTSEDDQGYENETCYNTERFLDSHTRADKKSVEVWIPSQGD